MSSQYLYIVGSSREGPLKIGVSCQPRGRLMELQTGHPEELKIFWIYPCPFGRVYEALVHRILAPYRLWGEWFGVPVEWAMGALWIASNDDGSPSPQWQLDEWCDHIGLSRERE